VHGHRQGLEIGGKLDLLRKLTFRFRGILSKGKVETLHSWMEEAGKTGIHSLERFVRLVKQYLSAVESAVKESSSNGPVEGQVNRLKALKRQMCASWPRITSRPSATATSLGDHMTACNKIEEEPI